MDYRGQSRCWENGEGQLSGFQARDDSGLPQSGGGENKPRGGNPSYWSICLLTCVPHLFAGTKMCN